MDPDATLKEIQEDCEALLAQDAGVYEAGEVDPLIEKVLALSDWIKKGGFLPRAWRQPAIMVPDDRREGGNG